MMRSLRRLLFGLFIAGFVSPVFAQGTIPVALTQSVDINGRPQAGALLYTFVVGTVSTPQSTFQDSGLTLTNPWPLVADQNGRIPMFYMANGSTHVRLTDSTGVVQFDYPSMLVIGASGGSGGGGSVDPTTILSTGDVKGKYQTGALSGFVRLNGLTIGSAVSGATERANADTQNLFVYLYNADSNLVVSGGRTGNALNDYNSNKTITVPDWRGQALGALADMGNSASGVLTATYFGTSPTTLGAAGGIQSNTIAQTNLPNVSLPTTVTDTRTWGVTSANGVGLGAASTANNPPAFQALGLGAGSATVPVVTVTGGSISGSTALGGSGTLFPTVGPMKLLTFYMKL